VGEAFDHRKAEALDDRGINGKCTFRVSRRQVTLRERSGINQRATGGLELAEAGNRGGTRLAVRQADQPELETESPTPEPFAGLEQREVILSAFNRADAEHRRRAALAVCPVRCGADRQLHAQRNRLDRWRVGGAEPLPIIPQGVAGIFRIRGNPIESQQLPQVAGKACDGFQRRKLGELQRDRIMKHRHARP
jgi:hypothetical protein